MQKDKMLLDVFEAIKQRKSLIPARASSFHSGAFEDVKFRVMASSLVNVDRINCAANVFRSRAG